MSYQSIVIFDIVTVILKYKLSQMGERMLFFWVELCWGVSWLCPFYRLGNWSCKKLRFQIPLLVFFAQHTSSQECYENLDDFIANPPGLVTVNPLESGSDHPGLSLDVAGLGLCQDAMPREWRVPTSNILFSSLLFLTSSIVDLQCCVKFRCTGKWFCYAYMDVLLRILFHYGVSQGMDSSSLGCTVGPCCLFVLSVRAFIC